MEMQHKGWEYMAVWVPLPPHEDVPGILITFAFEGTPEPFRTWII
jgi:hypothetical protein